MVSPLEKVTFLWTSAHNVTKHIQVFCIFNPLVDYRFKCIKLLHSQTRRHMIKKYINLECDFHRGICRSVFSGDQISILWIEDLLSFFLQIEYSQRNNPVKHVSR